MRFTFTELFVNIAKHWGKFFLDCTWDLLGKLQLFKHLETIKARGCVWIPWWSTRTRFWNITSLSDRRILIAWTVRENPYKLSAVKLWVEVGDLETAFVSSYREVRVFGVRIVQVMLHFWVLLLQAHKFRQSFRHTSNASESFDGNGPF